MTDLFNAGPKLEKPNNFIVPSILPKDGGTIRWGAITAPSGYTTPRYSVDRNINSGGWDVVYDAVYATNSMYVVPASHWKTVRYRVRFSVKGSDGTVYYSDYGYSPEIVVNQAPTAPSSITVPSTVSSEGSINVSWGSSTDPDGDPITYTLFRSSNLGPYYQVYSGSLRTFSESVSSSWNTVRYKVRAFDGEAYSDEVVSNAVSISLNQAPATPSYITVPSELFSTKSATISWGSSTDPDGDPITYTLERSVNRGSYIEIYRGSLLNYTDSILTSWNTVSYRVRVYDGSLYSSYQASAERVVTHNSPPEISVTTTNNRTLYEMDTILLSGSAKDTDSGDVVTIRYSINNGTSRTIIATISTGVNIPFDKSIQFKSGKLYDGETALTGTLAEGSQHFFTIWSEDNKGARSREVTINFYVVPNRSLKMTLKPFTPSSGLIDTDKITIQGNAVNPGNNGITVDYKVGNGVYREVYRSTTVGGDFSFQISLLDLTTGVNKITVRATDYYGAIDIKTLEITKDKKEIPLKTAVAKYKLTPLNGSAKGIVLWVEREVGDLAVDVEVHMGANGEPDNFVKMTKSSTAYVREGIEEDEFTFENSSAKENIILKITMNRVSTISNKGITLISGVLS